MTTRVVHCKIEPFDVYVGRPGPWGNPFSHLPSTRARYRVETREGAMAAFRAWVSTSSDPSARWIRAHVHELRGRTLGCWCKTARQPTRACHGDVLAEMADAT